MPEKFSMRATTARACLVAIEDVTERRALEREKDELLRQKDLLLQEMNHRINNSLQIIASILLLKAHTVQSEETRRHLQDAHERVMAVAAVQEQLQPTPFGAQIEARSYLTRLCESLAASMIMDDQPVLIRVEAGEGSTTSEQAVSMGLIATELIINALKHAFPGGAKGNIVVRFEFDRQRLAARRCRMTGWGSVGLGRRTSADRPWHEHRGGAYAATWRSGHNLRGVARHDRFGDRPPSRMTF